MLPHHLKQKEEKAEEKEIQSVTVKNRDWLLIPLGIAGLVLWLLFTPFRSDSVKLESSRKDAIRIGSNAIAEKYKINPEKWKILASVNNQVDERDIFVWREGGKHVYDSLLGTFLPPPGWNIRFVKTEGNVEDRAEEYSATITGKGKIAEIRHRIPESVPGKILDNIQAQAVADSALAASFSKKRPTLKEISVSPEKLENRTDWEFVYADTIGYLLKSGQARYYLKITGDEVTGGFPYLFVPEEWTRKFDEQQNINSIFQSFGMVVLIGTIGFGLVWGIFRWTRKKFSFKTFMVFALLCLSVSIIQTLNNWPEEIANYPTQMPFPNFITQILISLVISAVFISLLCGIITGSSIHLISAPQKTGKINLAYAAGLGMLIAGFLAISNAAIPKIKPEWISLDGLNSYIPELGTGLSGFTRLILYPAFGITLYRGIDFITSGWTKMKISGTLLFLVAGLAVMAPGFQLFSTWLIAGLATGLFLLFIYLFFIRIHFEWLPVSLGLLPVLKIIPVIIYNPFRGAVAGGAIYIIISAAVLFFWYDLLIPEKKFRLTADE